MNPESHDDLPRELEEALQALGSVQAPPELADRVRLARLGGERAPAELADRVELALFGKAQAPPELQAAVEEEVRLLTRPVLPFRVTLPRAAAAAVLLGLGVFMGLRPAAGPSPVDEAIAAWKQQKADADDRFLIRPVDAAQLSPQARGLAAGFGLPLGMEAEEEGR